MLRWFLPLALLLVLVGAPLAAREAPRNPAAPPATGESLAEQLGLLRGVLDTVRAEYVDDVTPQKLVESAINGMLTALDPHSAYLDAKAFTDIQAQTRGEFGGLGIEVTVAEGVIKIIAPIDDTPAARAGLQAGDLITHIDGQPVTELSLGEAVDKMRGTPGTRITLTIRRGALLREPLDVSLTRAVIRVQSVRSRLEADGTVGYLRITTFNEQTQAGLAAAISDLQRQAGDRLIGYVLDLRNNPGGLLEQAIAVGSFFLPDQAIMVTTRGRQPEDNQIYRASGGDRLSGRPVVVLINAGSASASEIVAGALQDQRRAVVAGSKSFGKGSVQTIMPIPGNGAAIRLTTARYYTPNGRSIQAEGIVPDIVIPPARVETLDESDVRREAELRGALDNEQETQPAAPAAKPAPQENAVRPGEQKPEEDYQLQRALDLLKGVNRFIERAAPRTPAG